MGNENRENHNEYYSKNCECSKFFMVALMTFLGSFLAFYVLMHQTMRILMHPVRNDVMKFEREFKNDFNRDFQKIKQFSDKAFNQTENRISSIQTAKTDEEYIIVVDLKRFNNDVNNIRFNVNGNTVTISGNSVKNKKNKETAYYFTESFEIPEKINMSEISKEQIKDKYIITIPIEN